MCYNQLQEVSQTKKLSLLLCLCHVSCTVTIHIPTCTFLLHVFLDLMSLSSQILFTVISLQESQQLCYSPHGDDLPNASLQKYWDVPVENLGNMVRK